MKRLFYCENILSQSRWLYLSIIVLLVSSCVPTKKLVYLQPEGGLKTEHRYDEMAASYSLKKVPYLLKPNDVITLRVASVTQDEYDFIQDYEENLGIIRKLNQYDQADQGSGGGAGGLQQLRALGGGGGGQSGEGGISPLMLDRMNTGFVLDLNGDLELPKIGNIHLAGLTIPEAEQLMKDSLEGYFEIPMVRIQLLNFHFTVLGEVAKEGRYTSFDPEPTIFDAITLAGNLTEFADRANIKIVRTEGDESRVYYLNALDESTLTANNYYLRRGDLIIIPPLQARTANRYTLPNISRTLGIVSAALSLAALIISLNR